MKPSLNELVYSILNIIKPQAKSNEPLSFDLIKFLVLNTRALLIKQDSNKGYLPDSYIIQDLGCAELISVDRAECCDIDIDCNFMRTKNPIPSTIELHQGELLTRVGPIDKIGRNYDLIKYERVPYEGYNKYTKNIIKSFRIANGGYVYLTIPKNNREKLLAFVNIQGVFENPELASEFVTCEGKKCYSDNDPFPCKMHMIQAIRDIILKNYGIIESNAVIDYHNDAKVDYKQQIVK